MSNPRLDGLLVLDKPAGITSRAAVDRALAWFPRGTRIGHTGTLDPLATGVLVLCIGTATRLAEYVQQMPKLYRAAIELGATSDTDDADGTITPMPGAVPTSREALDQALGTFVGTIAQTPPAYSAANVAGRRAYDLARRGEEVSLAPRTVAIHAIEVLDYTYPRLEIDVRCGKGTYIRSLARDLGATLGCGGYITALRRLQVGTFHASDAITLEADAETARRRLLPLARAADLLPRIALSSSEATRLMAGQTRPAPAGVDPGEVAVFDEADKLIAIAEVAEGTLHARKVFLNTS